MPSPPSRRRRSAPNSTSSGRRTGSTYQKKSARTHVMPAASMASRSVLSGPAGSYASPGCCVPTPCRVGQRRPPTGVRALRRRTATRRSLSRRITNAAKKRARVRRGTLFTRVSKLREPTRHARTRTEARIGRRATSSVSCVLAPATYATATHESNTRAREPLSRYASSVAGDLVVTHVPVEAG